MPDQLFRKQKEAVIELGRQISAADAQALSYRSQRQQMLADLRSICLHGQVVEVTDDAVGSGDGAKAAEVNRFCLDCGHAETGILPARKNEPRVYADLTNEPIAAFGSDYLQVFTVKLHREGRLDEFKDATKIRK